MNFLHRILYRSLYYPLFAGLLALIIFLMTGQPGFSMTNQDTRETVRVGYFNNGDFMQKAMGKDFVGYDIEYYHIIASYMGFNIEFVEFSTLDKALSALDNGDIKVLSGLARTPDREKKYLVSNLKMCTAHIAVQTRADDDRFSAADTASMDELRCGVLKGSNMVPWYSSWCQSVGITPHIVEFDTLAQRNSALFSGLVDAVASGSTLAGAQRIAEFPSQDLYFMFNRNSSGLKRQFDQCMNVLAVERPNFDQDLYAAYFEPSKNTSPSYSSLEKKFIREHPIISVALLEDSLPFSKKKANGEIEGLLPDYYRHLSSMTGLNFKFVSYSSRSACIEAVLAGKADLLGLVHDNVYETSGKGIILSNVYLKMPMVMLALSSVENVSRAAVVCCDETVIRKILKSAVSPIELKFYKNNEESFAALQANDVDAVICNQPSAVWLHNRHIASKCLISPFGRNSANIACGLRADPDSVRLRSILDKAILVDHGYLNNLIATRLLREEPDLENFIASLPTSAIVGVVAVILSLLVLSIVGLIVLVRHQKKERELLARQSRVRSLEEANRAKNIFFGTVSHDMRTPLNGIMGYTELALTSNSQAEIANCLQKIQISGAILSDLVNDTLLISRIESGKYPLSPTPNNLMHILCEVMESVRGAAEQKHIVLENQLPEEVPPTILVDKSRLQKILLSLLSNAVRFTPSGGKIRCNCKLTEVRNGKVGCLITVSDTGTGMSEQFLPHAFDPFSQEKPGDGNQGCGMGLTIAKKIVESMGGSISLESNLNAGTICTVQFDCPVCDAPVQCQKSSEDDFNLLKGKHILVCEDNLMNREIVKKLLEKHGMEVDTAEDGLIGYQKFIDSKQHFYDAILLDIRMPNLDGFATARKVREADHPDAQTIPILALSADAYDSDVRSALACGMDGHLAKPVNPQELFTRLLEVTKARTRQLASTSNGS